MGTDVIIRQGTPGDAVALAELAARTFRDTFGADNRAEDMAAHVAEAYGPEQQAMELGDPSVITLLLEVGGELAGYAQVRWGGAPSTVVGQAPVELWRFYIARHWHGKGLARRLMARVDEAAAERGAQTLWLGVWERNERAKAFYRKDGFSDVGSHVFLVGADPQTDRVLVRPVRSGPPNPHG